MLVIERAGTPTVAIRAYVRAGSRFDAVTSQARALPGLAHLTEHMLFQGTQTHSHRQLFAAVERYGGTLDAHTAKEYVVVSSVTPSVGFEPALAVIAEIMAAPVLDEERLWREKLVVHDEFRRAQDQHSVLYSLFAETLWPDHPLGWPTYGTVQGLASIGYTDVVEFHRCRYVAGNMLIVVCGNVSLEHVLEVSTGHLTRIRYGREQPPAPGEPSSIQGQQRAHQRRDTNQLYLMIGVPTVGMKHPDRSALKIIERVLGMGGSARLFQSLREHDQLVYSVHTVNANYEDAGFFAVQAVCHPDNFTKVKNTILAEWQRLAEHGPTADELADAKCNYAGTLARQFETNSALAGIYGVEALLNEVETLEQAVERINAVLPGDVVRVAGQYLSLENCATASIGPLDDIS